MTSVSYMRWNEPRPQTGQTPTVKNHTVTLVGDQLYVFGGYDGKKNHNSVHIFDCVTHEWRSCPTGGSKGPPAGRNGHTATLADNRIFIVGGWLGSGPLAASDMHVLFVDSLEWLEPPVIGKPPGPCNMHTADYIPFRRQIFVFRGGDGREYLNDLHALDVDTYAWAEVKAEGQCPLQRANHSSAVVGTNLFIFGGWDGRRRLNDIHVLDTQLMLWSKPCIRGPLPHPRAGMTFTRLRDKIYLFGGSGPSAKCFNDLQVFDPAELSWVPVKCTRGNQDRDEEEPEGAPPRGPLGEPGNSQGDEGSRVEVTANDQDGGEQPRDCIVLQGQGPGRRAGHTATMVGRRLFVFGGSYGSDYLNDFFVLDTDPPPEMQLAHPSSLQRLQCGLRRFVNQPEFSDVCFVVEGRRIHGHRVVLSLCSQRFRAMFGDGFREASQKEIVIDDFGYRVYEMMMQYLYTGELPELDLDSDPNGFQLVIELLELADQYMLDHLKQMCERVLQTAVTADTVDYLLQVADRTNSYHLAAVCRHFLRNAGMGAPEGCMMTAQSGEEFCSPRRFTSGTAQSSDLSDMIMMDALPSHGDHC